MSVKVFIDGSSGTTGLRIADRLAARPEIELLSISAEGRKDVNERAKVINSADLAFLCLPDAASREVMPLLRPDVKVLDTSTAFRTDAAWDYGFPELKGQKEKIQNSYRVAVPGCYASGFISIARPLVELGLAPKDYPFSCTGISGYSGGGKKMIAEYESADRPAHSKLDAPKSYGLSLAHKHLPEMKEISGLAHTPMFVPVVCDYYCGMQVLVPLDLTVAGTTAEAVAAGTPLLYLNAVPGCESHNIDFMTRHGCALAVSSDEELQPMLQGILSGAIDPRSMVARRADFPTASAAAVCDLALRHAGA